MAHASSALTRNLLRPNLLVVATAGALALAGCASAQDARQEGRVQAEAGVDAGATAVTVVAVGDIACKPGAPVTATTCKHGKVADKVAQINPTAVLTLGDNQYEKSSMTELTTRGGWTGTWSRFNAKTYPAVGNHEWNTANAQAYRDYFKARHGGRLWYSYNLGAWHFISLDSDCAKVGGCGPTSRQGTWLKKDLAANQGKPTVVYWHHPRFSSGKHGSLLVAKPLWDAVVADRDVEIVLNGHDHNYERFKRMGVSGPASNGVRLFVVGTGGKSFYCDNKKVPGQRTFQCSSHGVLKLTLRPTGFDWKFVAATGTYADSGTSGLR